MVEPELLREATRLAGAKTYSATVQLALRDLIRRIKAKQILDLAGSGLWEGHLDEMRNDQKGTRKRR